MEDVEAGERIVNTMGIVDDCGVSVDVAVDREENSTMEGSLGASVCRLFFITVGKVTLAGVLTTGFKGLGSGGIVFLSLVIWFRNFRTLDRRLWHARR